jgi:hypothetical protein
MHEPPAYAGDELALQVRFISLCEIKFAFYANVSEADVFNAQ